MKNLTTERTTQNLKRSLEILNELDAKLDDFWNIAVNTYSIQFLGNYVDGIVSEYKEKGFKFEEDVTTNEENTLEFHRGYAYYNDFRIEVNFVKHIKNESNG